MMCRISSSNLEGVVCLPLNAYSLVHSASHDDLLVEGGLLNQDGLRLVCQQTYSQNRCQTVSLAVELQAS